MKIRTYEKKAHVKNGIARLFFSVLAIALEIAFIVVVFTRLNDYAEGINIATRILAVVLVVCIYAQDRTSSMKTPWIMLILAFPIFGIIMYLLVGLNGHTYKMRQRYDAVDAIVLPMLEQGPRAEHVKSSMEELRDKNEQLASISYYLQEKSGFPVYADCPITYYDEAYKGFEAQKEALKKAKHFIFMEYFAIEQAEAWNQVEKILVERVKAGVEVRVFYDDIGSIAFINGDFAKHLNALGIQCRIFNPFMPGLNFFLNNRDHRKIMVIDGLVGFTGGYNMANEYFNLTHPYGYWKDTGVQITGLAVRSLTATFLENWNAVKGNDIDDADFGKYLEQPYADPHAMAEEIGETGQSRAYVQPYADRPMDNEHVGEEVYISLINKATRYCWFVTPYLILTDEMVHAIRLAKKRGVDVRIITPAIPDKRIVYAVTRSYYHCLAKHGVRIYEYTPGFCHAKMCVVDDVVATCGTINLDYRSLYHHFENGCLYAYGPAVQETRQDMEAMMRESLEVTEKYNTGRSQGMRFIQMLLRLIAPLL